MNKKIIILLLSVTICVAMSVVTAENMSGTPKNGDKSIEIIDDTSIVQVLNDSELSFTEDGYETPIPIEFHRIINEDDYEATDKDISEDPSINEEKTARVGDENIDMKETGIPIIAILLSIMIALSFVIKRKK